MYKLYGAWRSLAAYRVRVALNLKRVAYNEEMIDIAAGNQSTPTFLALNPQAAVPVLVIDNSPPLTQSLAILEFLEELFPEPPLLPSVLKDRARVRSLALLFVADHHPLITPRVTRRLVDEFGANDGATAAWTRYWLRQSLEQAEARLASDKATGNFCHGDVLSIADAVCAAKRSYLIVLVRARRLVGADWSRRRPYAARNCRYPISGQRLESRTAFGHPSPRPPGVIRRTFSMLRVAVLA